MQWRGANLNLPFALTGEAAGEARAAGQRVPPELLQGFIRQAVTLNRKKGDPTKRA